MISKIRASKEAPGIAGDGTLVYLRGISCKAKDAQTALEVLKASAQQGHPPGMQIARMFIR